MHKQWSYTYLLSSLHWNSQLLGRTSSGATHIFYPVSIETAGSWDAQAVELIEEIGRRSAMETDDPNETMYPFLRTYVAIQTGNTPSFTNTFDMDNKVISHSSHYNFSII